MDAAEPRRAGRPFMAAHARRWDDIDRRASRWRADHRAGDGL